VRGLLDTSVFVAFESGRSIDVDALPDESAISVVTLAELEAGVLAASTTESRSIRMGTLRRVNEIELIGVDESVARMWALMRVTLGRGGRKINLNDLWIAATAASRGMPVVTQDSDFSPVEGIGGLQIIRV
jgi:predicted nucleic acid-binding protein